MNLPLNPEQRLRFDNADLMQRAVELADSMTEILLPEELRAAGFRFVFDVAPEKKTTPVSECPYCWGSHGCNLSDGHEGDHQCVVGHEEDPDTRERGSEDVFHFQTFEKEGS